jgi:hypothetical protein
MIPAVDVEEAPREHPDIEDAALVGSIGMTDFTRREHARRAARGR